MPRLPPLNHALEAPYALNIQTGCSAYACFEIWLISERTTTTAFAEQGRS